MIRAEIIVKGRVQKVGYRDFAQEAARKLKVTGFVENLKPYDVRIVAEGEEDTLKKFIEVIKNPGQPAEVESVEINFSEATGEFDYFEIKRGDWKDELGERMDFASYLLYSMLEKQDLTIEKLDIVADKVDKVGEKVDKVAEKVDIVAEKVDKVGEKVDNVAEKVDKVGEKIDSVGEKVDNVAERVDKVAEKVDNVGEKVDMTRKELGGKIDSVAKGIEELKAEHIKTRELSHDIFYSEVQQLRKELYELKASVEEIKKRVGIG